MARKTFPASLGDTWLVAAVIGGQTYRIAYFDTEIEALGFAAEMAQINRDRKTGVRYTVTKKAVRAVVDE